MGILLFILGGLLAAAGVILMVAALFGTPIAGLGAIFAGIPFSPAPFIGMGLLGFILFLAGIYLMKTTLSGKSS